MANERNGGSLLSTPPGGSTGNGEEPMYQKNGKHKVTNYRRKPTGPRPNPTREWYHQPYGGWDPNQADVRPVDAPHVEHTS